MVETAGTAIADARPAGARGFAARLGGLFARLNALFAQAFETELALRRMFLWLPVAAGAGVVAYMGADREPALWMLAPVAAVFAGLAFLARTRRAPFLLLCGLAAFFAGELSAAWHSARVAAPIVDKVTVGAVEGFIEQMVSAAPGRASFCGSGRPRGSLPVRRRFACGSRPATRRRSRRALSSG